MGRSGSSARAAINAAQFQQKRKVTDLVRARFARFGDEVLSIVLGYALQPRRMPMLLRSLNIRNRPGELTVQLDEIYHFLASGGRRAFMSRVKPTKFKLVHAADLDEFSEDLSDDQLAELMRDAENAVALAPEVQAAPAVVTPLYRGSCRRVIPERRVNKDRRSELMAVRKNQRYGGDRRKRPFGRRRNDRNR